MLPGQTHGVVRAHALFAGTASISQPTLMSLRADKRNPWRVPVALAARLLAVSVLAVASAPASHAVAADDATWPSRPIRLVVAQAMGGPPDLIARFVAERLGPALGTSVVVENRPGASGIIGVDAVAHAAPDGYTMLIGTLSTHALVPHSSQHGTYDALRDFTPIVNLFRSIKVLWINAALPAKTLSEWTAYARARAGLLNYASGGVGSSNHIDMELWQGLAHLQMVHIPYNGPNAAITAVARGDAHAMIVSIGTGLGLARSGQIRPLVVFNDQRSALLPDVPSATELGLTGIDLAAWIGLLAPAGLEDSIATRVNAEIVRIFRSPEAVAWANRQGLQIIADAPDEFARTMARDYRRWGEVFARMPALAE